jgi:hypothetical protein
MKLFNFDLHISVISDVKKIFEEQGHQVDSWMGSGHSWVMGKQPVKPKHISRDNWTSLSVQKADAFFNEYKNKLSKYDAFICCYPPSFSLLYHKFNKPIITVAATRYEAPFFDSGRWEWFNNFLREKIDENVIIPISNNKYDSMYAEYYTGKKWEHIPSLCEYTNAKYNNRHSSSIYFSTSKHPKIRQNNKIVDRDKLGNFKWTDIVRHSSFIHIPYNASLMSIFEHYTQEVHMFLPSYEFLIELKKKHAGIMNQVSWQEIMNIKYDKNKLTSYLDIPDPNIKCEEMYKYWYALADFYDEEYMPHIIHFDSFDDLENKMNTTNYNEVSSMMKEQNVVRKEKIYEKWSKVLGGIK